MGISRRRFLELSGVGSASLFGAVQGCRSAAPAAPPSDEPVDLLTRQAAPYNAEPALARLAESWITPIRHFYIRRHGSVPRVEPEAYELRVTGLVERPLRMTLNELTNNFSKETVTATLQCAGNRRNEHARRKKVGGVQWDAGAIGNATWSGPRLKDVLTKAGLKSGAKHVSFTALDECVIPGGKSHFGGSIPLGKAMAPESLLAYEMNGRSLTAEHGFPVRSLIPGFLGARSAKWLGEISVSDRPSENFFQARDYKLFPPEVGPETAQWETAAALEGMPTNSAICSPAPGQTFPPGKVLVRGYAIAATGHTLTKIQVSADEGKSWVEGRLQPSTCPFSWRLWEAEVALPIGPAFLAARAWDSSGAVQPEAPPWNFKGYLFNGWHRVPLKIA
jgi:sulfite oxidase